MPIKIQPFIFLHFNFKYEIIVTKRNSNNHVFSNNINNGFFTHF